MKEVRGAEGTLAGKDDGGSQRSLYRATKYTSDFCGGLCGATRKLHIT